MNKQLPHLITLLMCWLLIAPAQASIEDTDTSPQLLINDAQQGSQPALLMTSHIKGQVNGLVVSMTLTQEFQNTSANWVNGRYVFPLPDDAVVDSLTLTNEDRVLQGVVKEKQEAKKIFAQAKAAGKKAGLLEQNRPNLFAMSMANIAPQSIVKAEITWVQKVHYEGGVFSLSLPTTLTPRYIPGESLQLSLNELTEQAEPVAATIQQGWAVHTDQVPDASEITPPQVTGMKRVDTHRIDIDIHLNAGLPLDKVSSISHAIKVEQQGSAYRVSFQNKDELMDRDVLLQWQAAAHSIPQAAMFTEKQGEAYYNLIMINPPVKNIVSTLPKDVTFIIDTSGSMAGGSMEQAKNGLLTALNLLSRKDRFNIIEFNNKSNQLYDDSHSVSDDSLRSAQTFVKNLHADGGTEMMGALKRAIAQPEHEEYLRQIIFITDGSVGNEKALFSYINQHLGKARLFTVGIGSAPNTHFMHGAAKYGRGTSTQISDLSEVNAKITRLFEKLSYPVMRDIKAQWPSDITVESYPANIPDLYVSEPIMLIARSEQPIDTVTLTGQIAGQLWQQQLTVEQGGTASAENINKIWALDKVNDLIEKSVLYGEPVTKYKNDIVKIGVENQIVTQFTSFVAVEKEISKPEHAVAKDAQVPNLLPNAKKVHAPGTATPATLQIILGLILLLCALVYQRFAQRPRQKGLQA
ncbi:marine proteobacterial sortase target protein [Amphritea atlantica]|uniref:Marine proteobacterial sortase target protein n=1 Tax=Amphritea atlantica TaxID=355243 RepID=A0ABY5GV90_9GAMM|nr:marine proteobacterial sortase target protein [Amphritea atlantica]